jgi:HAD superfamily hydrolase (TIGR01509 family)
MRATTDDTELPGKDYEPAQRERFEAAIPGSDVTLCLPRARPETLAERILRRGRAEAAGATVRCPGWTLEGLRQYGASAAPFAERLEGAGPDPNPACGAFWLTGLDAHRHELMTGGVSLSDVFKAIFLRTRTSPKDPSALVRRDLELLREHSTVYPDVLLFLPELRRRGTKVALISNCAPNAGPLLVEPGLADEVDQMILACDVGSAKPDPVNYQTALESLGAEPTAAVLVDDQAAHRCSTSDSATGLPGRAPRGPAPPTTPALRVERAVGTQTALSAA